MHVVGALVQHFQTALNLGLLEAHPGLDERHRTEDQRIENVFVIVDLAECGHEIELVLEELRVQFAGGLEAPLDAVFFDGKHLELADLVLDHIGSARIAADLLARLTDRFRRIVRSRDVLGARFDAVYILPIRDLA